MGLNKRYLGWRGCLAVFAVMLFLGGVLHLYLVNVVLALLLIGNGVIAAVSRSRSWHSAAWNDRFASEHLQLIRSWAALDASVPVEIDRLDWVAKYTGIEFRSLDFARRVRNDLAHGGTRSIDQVRAAQAIVDQALHALA